MSIIIEIKNMPMPSVVINLIGFIESEVMPSTANEIIFFSGYFDSPA